MYTGQPLPPLPSVVLDADWATGFVHLCQQTALDFGSNRRTPVALRPVLEVRKDGARAVVLPCTSQDKTANAQFYELGPDRVEWTRPSGNRSFAYSRYETVGTAVLRQKIGVMPHPARIALMQWIKGRY
jgi:hypothetical protein